jgi:hypothetical protein
MKVNFRFFILLAILSLITYGCAGTANVQDMQRTGLEISTMSTGIGAVDANNNSHDIQRFSYSIALSNNDKDTVFIKEVTLILPKEFEETLITKQLTVSVNKEILPKSPIEIKGSLDFKANGLSKDDIIKLHPRISSVKVTNERTISLEKWSH